MPITVAHPAILLPLARTPLPFAALAIGAMVPDVPLFVDRDLYGTTHSLLGVLTIDLLLALAAWSVWAWFMARALADLAPSWVRERLPVVTSPTVATCAWAVPAVLIGSASHVAWDSFTHAGNVGVRAIAWLQEEHLGWRGHAWAQYVSGVVGMAVLAVVAVGLLRRSPVRDPGPRVLPRSTAPAAFALCVLASVATFATGVTDAFGPAVFDGAVVGLGSVVLAAVLLTVGWHAAVRSRAL